MKSPTSHLTRPRETIAAIFYALISSANTSDAAVPVYRPSDDAQVVLRLTSSTAETALSRLRQAARNLQDSEAIAKYVDALIVIGKQSGNERYYGFAEQALSAAPQSVRETLALKQAQLLQHRHEFRSAEHLLNALLSREPRHREARLMRAQLRLHLHEPEQALRDCVALMPQVDLLTSTTCFAQGRAALGDVSRAYDLVTKTLQTQSAPASTRSYSAGVAAELAARLGRNTDASRWYRLAFEMDSESHYPRIALADWLLSQGQSADALAIASTGASPADKLRVTLAEKSAQNLNAQQLQLAWTEAKANGERNHLRDQARFELIVLQDTQRAHTTALDNFTDHYEAEDALILLATARLIGDRQALARIQTWSKERRYVDTRIDSALAGKK